MSKHTKHVPGHRAPSSRRTGSRPIARTVEAFGLAAAATGIAVSGGVLSSVLVDPDQVPGSFRLVGSSTSETRDTPERTDEVTVADLEDRRVQVSRSDRRGGAKVAVLGKRRAKAQTEDDSSTDPREIGRVLLAEFGFAADQYDCLDALYVSESDWRVDADNPTSSAYGIPQALTQLHDLPAGYMTSAESQIRWGLEYIADSYGTPCSAWGFKQGNGWY